MLLKACQRSPKPKMLNDSACHKQMFALSLSLPHWCLCNYAETPGRVESNFKTLALALETSQVQVHTCSSWKNTLLQDLVDICYTQVYPVTRPGCQNIEDITLDSFGYTCCQDLDTTPGTALPGVENEFLDDQHRTRHNNFRQASKLMFFLALTSTIGISPPQSSASKPSSESICLVCWGSAPSSIGQKHRSLGP